MVKKFNDIFNDYPRLFGEELYLCNEFGKVLTGRGGAGRDLKNAFSLIPKEEFNFIMLIILHFSTREVFLILRRRFSMASNARFCRSQGEKERIYIQYVGKENVYYGNHK